LLQLLISYKERKKASFTVLKKLLFRSSEVQGRLHLNEYKDSRLIRAPKSNRFRSSAIRVRLTKEAKPPRQRVVGYVCTRVHALVEKSQIARRDSQSLIRLRTHHLAVADALSPCSPIKTDIIGASERVRLRGRKIGPITSKTVRGPGAEVPIAIAADGLDDEEIRAIAHIVHARGLKQAVYAVVSRLRNHHVAHAIWEAADVRRGAIEVTVVIGREEIAIGGVADSPHVNPVSTAYIIRYDAGLAAEEVCWR